MRMRIWILFHWCWLTLELDFSMCWWCRMTSQKPSSEMCFLSVSLHNKIKLNRKWVGVSYAGHVLLVCVVKVVDFLLEGVQDLAVSRHVCGQDQRDGSLKRGTLSEVTPVACCLWILVIWSDGEAPWQESPTEPYLSYLFEGLGVKVGEDVAVGLREDLEGHSTVVILQGGDVVVADCQLCSGIDLVPGREREREEGGGVGGGQGRRTEGEKWRRKGGIEGDGVKKNWKKRK